MVVNKYQWKNWAENQSCSPDGIFTPINEEELLYSVRHAIKENQKVKAVGTGHSFTGTALTDGYLIDLSKYDKILSVDPNLNQVTVQVGKKLEHLSPELWDHGLAMSDLGDIAYQSVAGAISTGTHGTGLTFGCLATQVVAARVITGEGEIVECSMVERPDLLRAAVVGVGAAGLLSTVTLQLEPAFNLHAQEVMLPFQEVLDQQDQFIIDNEHFEYFCVPGMDQAFTKRNNRTSLPVTEFSKWQKWFEEEFSYNYLRRLAIAANKVSPRLAALIGNSLPSGTREDYVDRSYSVFTSERKLKFIEMEYFIPREFAREALQRVLDFVEKSGLEISMPIEVRWAQADDIPLSMCSGRDTASIAIHVRQHEAFEPYFVPVETIMRDYGGRPHWGKMHFQTAETLAPLYPKWEEFQLARKELDPLGLYSNVYIDRVLGPIY